MNLAFFPSLLKFSENFLTNLIIEPLKPPHKPLSAEHTIIKTERSLLFFKLPNLKF